MKKLSDFKSFGLKQFKRLIDNNSDYSESNLLFYTALIMYIFLAILLFNYYKYIITYDGIFYIGIAHEYALSDFSNAINGYWSPLFSWLLAPFLLFGSDNTFFLYSAKIFSLIIGFFTLIGVKFLFSKFIISKKIINTVLFAMVPIILYFAFYVLTPDLLLVCILLFYLGLIFDPKYSFRSRNGFVCGFLGALAYFSKTYAFIFFICHFILFNLFFYFKAVDSNKRSKVKKNLILGLTVFLALSGIWAGLISDKYDEITIGTSGTINLAKVGPESVGSIFDPGLIAPRNKSPVSAWEDPSLSGMNQWNPLGSVQSFIFELNIFWNNILNTGKIFLGFSVFSLLILVVALIWVIKYKDEVSKKLMYLLITILIYSGGYCLIFVESRYLWIISILIFLMGVYLLKALNKNGFIKTRIRNVLLLFLIFSFMIMPIIGLIYSANNENFHIYNLAYTMKNDYNIHGNLASNDDFVGSLVLTYYLNGTYYGQTKRGINLNGLETEFKKKNIDYYLVWETSNQTDIPYKEINSWEFNNNGTIEYLKVYSIKNGV